MDIIRMKDDSLVIGHYGKTERHATGYESAKGANQGNYVLRESVVDYVLHVVDGNSKTGKTLSILIFRLSILANILANATKKNHAMLKVVVIFIQITKQVIVKTLISFVLSTVKRFARL